MQAPYSITAKGNVQQDGGVGATVVYASCTLTIPEDGIWRVQGFAAMASKSATDAKWVSLQFNGVTDTNTLTGAADGTLGVYQPFSTAAVVRRLAKGTVIQLQGSPNGGSIVSIGNTLSNPSVRITAEKVG